MDRLEFVDGTYVRWRVNWPLFKETLSRQFRRATLHMARTRRPVTYEGLEDIHIICHRKLLRELHPHAVTIMLRVWTGCAMTAKRKHLLDPAYSPMCQCEQAEQTIEHLLYHCPLVSPIPDDLREWQSKPSAFSITLLCSYWATPDDMAKWERMCKRAIHILAQSVHPERRVEWKGHCVAYDTTLSLVYCIRCHISRKSRDQAFITTQECEGDMLGVSLAEGEYVRVEHHLLRLTMRDWKRASLRPALTCIFCKRWAWARSRRGWSHPCVLSGFL